MVNFRLQCRVRNDRGVTALETSIVLVVVGIMGAISLPSFLGWYEAKQVESAITQIQSALKETQQEAMKRGTGCTLAIPSGVAPTLTGTCLKSGDRVLKQVTLTHNNVNTPWVITFDFKGRNVNASNSGTLVLHATSNPAATQCLVVSTGIGLARFGTYTGNVNTPSPSNCMTS